MSNPSPTDLLESSLNRSFGLSETLPEEYLDDFDDDDDEDATCLAPSVEIAAAAASNDSSTGRCGATSTTSVNGGASSVTLNEATGVITSAGTELKTSSVTLRVPKGSLDKETFVHLYEIANGLVKTLDTVSCSCRCSISGCSCCCICSC